MGLPQSHYIFSFHYSGADTRVSDNSGMNPFMIAVEKGHLGVVKAMMRKDPGLVSLSICFGSTVIHWALQKGHQRSAFFKVCFFICIVNSFSVPNPFTANKGHMLSVGAIPFEDRFCGSSIGGMVEVGRFRHGV